MRRLLFLILVPLFFLTTCTEPVVDTFGNIAGTVTDSRTHSPLAGVTVKITPTGSSQVTGNDGSFQFDNLDVQEYTISFSKNGYYSHEEKVSVKPGQSSPIQISLTPKSSINGLVRDSKTNSLLAGVTVKLSPGGNSVVTGKDGAFQFDNLDTRDYTLTFAKSGYNTYEERVTVKSGVSSTIQVNLVPKSSIVGTVKDSESQNLLAGVTVKITPGGSSVVTGNDGAFSFENLSAQEYTLSFTKSGYNSKDQKVTVSDGETKTVDVLLTETSITLPTLYMNSPTNVTKTSVRLHATLSSTGGAQILQHGFCYSTEHNPTTVDQVSSLGIRANTGEFAADISGLTEDTQYYVRAYAQNSSGIAYSEEISFKTLSENNDGDDGDDDDGGDDSGTIAVLSGLKLYYTFDNEDCTDATDNEVDALGVNNPTYLTDTPNGKGKALFINGTKEQYVNIPFNLFKGLDRFSISLWIKDFSAGSVISGIESSVYSNDMIPKFYMNSNNKVGFDMNTYSYGYEVSLFSSYNYSSIQSGKWHHIVVMYDHNEDSKYSGVASLYVDGVLVDNMNSYWRDPSAITKVHIGGNGNGTFPGYSTFKVDNVRIYGRCLNKNEVKEIYNSEK